MKLQGIFQINYEKTKKVFFSAKYKFTFRNQIYNNWNVKFKFMF